MFRFRFFYSIILIASILGFMFGKIGLAGFVLWLVLPPLVFLAIVALLAGLAVKADEMEKKNREFKDGK